MRRKKGGCRNVAIDTAVARPSLKLRKKAGSEYQKWGGAAEA
jgi:hypothetical protein